MKPCLNWNSQQFTKQNLNNRKINGLETFSPFIVIENPKKQGERHKSCKDRPECG